MYIYNIYVHTIAVVFYYSLVQYGTIWEVCTVCTVCRIRTVQYVHYVQYRQYVQYVRYVRYVPHVQYAQIVPSTKYAKKKSIYWQILDIVLVTDQVHMRAQDKVRSFSKVVSRSVPIWCVPKYVKTLDIDTQWLTRSFIKEERRLKQASSAVNSVWGYQREWNCDLHGFVSNLIL